MHSGRHGGLPLHGCCVFGCWRADTGVCPYTRHSLQREPVVLALEVVVEEPLVDDDVVVEGFDDKGVGAHTDILRQFADGLTAQHLRLPAF